MIPAGRCPFNPPDPSSLKWYTLHARFAVASIGPFPHPMYGFIYICRLVLNHGLAPRQRDHVIVMTMLGRFILPLT